METKKLTTEELKELQQLQNSINELTIELGSISIVEKQIEERKDTANSIYKVTMDLQKSFMRKIEDKYGNVSIDINTGELTNQ